MTTFDRTNLKSILESIEPTARLVFACCCCERLLPNYLAYDTDGLGYEQLRGVLDRVWTEADSTHSTEDLAEAKPKLVGICNSLVPSEGSASIWATLAEWAVGALIAVLESDGGQRIDFIIEAARCSFQCILDWLDIVSTYSPSSDQLDVEILRSIRKGFEVPQSVHELVRNRTLSPRVDSSMVQAELAKQVLDLTSLRSFSDLRHSELLRLRKASERRGVQPFLRGVLQEP